MALAKVKIGVLISNYNGIASVLLNVINGLTANPVNFPAPNPPIATLIAQANILSIAIATWGPVGNRGSHADWLALQSASHTAYGMLVQEAAYVQSLTDPSITYASQAAFIITSGFAVKNLSVPQGLLGVPQNFHQVFSNVVDSHTPWLDWKKPTGLNSVNNVKSYEVFRADVDVQPSLSIATVTETKFIDTDPTLIGKIWYYWIQAVNEAGKGAPTASLLVSVPL